MTIEGLIDETPEEQREWLQQLLEDNPDLDYVTIDRKLEDGWAEWQSFPHATLNKKYIFIQVPERWSHSLIFANMDNMISVIEQNRFFFEKFFGDDFSIENIEQKLRSGHPDFWCPLLEDYVALGTLLGYGHQNAIGFDQRNRLHYNDQSPYPSASEDVRKAEYCLDEKPFTLPIFIMFDPKESRELVDTYKKERDEIQAQYMGHDFLEVTLSKLTSTQ